MLSAVITDYTWTSVTCTLSVAGMPTYFSKIVGSYMNRLLQSLYSACW